jgi:hypothetical protein
MADADRLMEIRLEMEVEKLRSKVGKLQEDKISLVRALYRAQAGWIQLQHEKIDKMKAKGKGHRGGRSVKKAKEE